MIRRSSLLVCLLLLGVSSAVRAQFASGDLTIRGSALRVLDATVVAHLDTPVVIGTEYGGKSNDEAPVILGLAAVGDLTGPGLATPIRLETTPGHRFTVPGLPEEGTYFLQNIRLESNGRFVGSASPSAAMITVANVMKPSVSVRQLSPEELRARGISLDGRNYEVYEYTFSFNLDSSEVVNIPYLVVVDPITHIMTPLTRENPYTLPSDNAALPERWSPPPTVMFELAEQGGSVPTPPPTPFDPPRPRPSIPAAIVLPNSLAVLHQFFGVVLMVSNGAPEGSTIELDSVTGTIQLPPELRVSKTNPSVTFGRPVPVLTVDGQTVLVAQADGKAEYILEGLKSGTHPIDIEVRATMTQHNQPDMQLVGKVRSSIIVYDPRFNITFSHPDVVRAGEPYVTWTFITNASPVAQTIEVSSGTPHCGSAADVGTVCLASDTAETFTATIPAGDTSMLKLNLVSKETGRVFATAGSIGDGNAIASASVQLTLGVSSSGIPLSAATLSMPHYARYLDPKFVEDNLRLLGLGYSLATAPRSTELSKFPPVVKSDVFHRAGDIARAGQRIFIGDDPRDAFANLALDLLGNDRALAEWDQLRRSEVAGFVAGAALAREIETAALAGADRSFDGLLPRFASATAHREPYAAVLVHGPAVTGVRPYALSVSATALPLSPGIAIPSGSTRPDGWKRSLPYGELLSLNDGDAAMPATGELALLGRWSGALEVMVKLATTGSFEIVALFPGEGDAKLIAKRLVSGSAGDEFTFVIDRGTSDIGSAEVVALPDLRIVAARQDLYLDAHGHKVSALFNRPVTPAESTDWRAKFSADVIIARDGLNLRRARAIEGTALQSDGRILDLNFSQSLSSLATYEIKANAIDDPLRAGATLSQTIVPRIDNSKDGGIVYGRVLSGANEPLANAAVAIDGGGYSQFDTSDPSGVYLFDFVPRDTTRADVGTFTLYARHGGRETKVAGAIRSIGEVRQIDLVFRGRGAAEGTVRDQSGVPVNGATVTVGSVLFSEFRQAQTDASGRYRVGDLSVGPLTFSARDARGNVVFAAGELRTPGEILVQDLTLQVREHPGTASIRGRVIRSDRNGEPATGARVRVYTQGYGFDEKGVGADGAFDFDRVPAGLVSVIAADWSISREAAVVDLDLRADESRDVGTLTLLIPDANETTETIEGDVIRIAAGQSSAVPNAIVEISGIPAVVADGAGHYVYPNVPVKFSLTTIKAYDPVTKQTGAAQIPQLNVTDASSTIVPITLAPSASTGRGTVRVVLTDAAGNPVSGYRVISPGYPVWGFDEIPGMPGVYERKDVYVGNAVEVWAVPPGAGFEGGDPQQTAYGHQVATGSAQVAFEGHVSSIALRLPGQGTVKARLIRQLNPSTTMAEHGRIKISYRVWSETEQGYVWRDDTVETNPADGEYATFTGIPAGQTFYVESFEHTGSASGSGQLVADGSVRAIDLLLSGLSTVRGRVFDIDGMTPLEGAVVQIEDGVTSQGARATDAGGAYEFHNVGSGRNIKVTARSASGEIERVGFAQATTPPTGGIVEDVDVTMREAGTIHGTILLGDGDSDPSNNPPARKARFWIRELDFPNREFGSAWLPLEADDNGEFYISNVFRGPFRASARDAASPDLQGEASGVIAAEGNVAEVRIIVGAEGSGDALFTVTGPQGPVASAEVSVYRGDSLFDFATTDASGEVTFRGLPVGQQYSASAYSKALSSASSRVSFVVTHGTVATATLELLESAAVYGTLSDHYPQDGGATRLVNGAHVTLASLSFETRATTNSAGAFELTGVRPGSFRLSARDPLSQRRASLESSVASGDRVERNLELERAFPLTVNVFLPTDSGSQGVLAPAVAVEVTQGTEYLRSAQGNQLVFEGLVARLGYTVTATEIGGESRVVRATRNAFTDAPAAQRVDLTFPAYGSVHVRVTSSSSATSVANARVQVYGNGSSAFAYTDASGFATVMGIRVGEFSVQAVSADGKLTASASGTLASQSIPADISLTLGSYASVSGLIEAEEGGPSVGTRVVAAFNGSSVETRTDGDGRYTFSGVAVNAGQSTPVTLSFVGPDDVTPGHENVVVSVSSTDTLVTVSTIRLDATPPRLLTYFPADGAVNVSPDTILVFEFSEPVTTASLSSAIRVMAFNETTPVNATFTSTLPTQTPFRITMTLAQVAGQTYPLKSNTLYTVVVSDALLRDAAGHPLPAPRGFSFRTSDYAAPRIRSTNPPAGARLATNQVFEFAFTEPLNPVFWQPGGAGRVLFAKRDASGSWSDVIPAGTATLDASTNASIRFVPAAPIESNARYRIAFQGVEDLQGNPMLPGESGCACEWDAVDNVTPQITLVSPVPAGQPLIENVSYAFAVSTADSDIARVEFFRTDGGTPIYLGKDTTPPYAWTLVAPVGATSFGIRAIAWDTSENESAVSELMLQVRPNVAPQLEVTARPQQPTYAGATVPIDIVVADEGLRVSFKIRLSGTLAIWNPTTASWREEAYVSSPIEREASRFGLAAPWPTLTEPLALPTTLKGGSAVTVTVDAEDLEKFASTASTSFEVAIDAVPPTVQILTPLESDVFDEAVTKTFTVAATVVENESGVDEVHAELDGTSYLLTPASTPETPDRFVATLPVPDAFGADIAEKTVTVTALDYARGSSSASVTFGVKPNTDPRDPVVSFTCGVGGMYPAGHSAVIGVHAIGNANNDPATKVTKLEFYFGGATVPSKVVDVTTPPTDNTYRTTFDIPSDASPGPVEVQVKVFNDSSGQDGLPRSTSATITVSVIVPDKTFTSTETLIDMDQWVGKSVVVMSGTYAMKGTGETGQLIILDGATVSPWNDPAQTIDVLTVASKTIFVECGGVIDVRGKGYPRGSTYPDGIATLPGNGTGGSHLGYGGYWEGPLGSTYGSVYRPLEGGAGGWNGSGSAGGGVVRIDGTGGVVVIDGDVLANGSPCSDYGCGAGGSVWITATEYSGSGKIEARGGEGSAHGNGGGGAISLDYTRRSVTSPLVPTMTARGGVSQTNHNGGAGTIYVKGPESVEGDLTIDNGSAPSAEATVLPALGSGTVVSVSGLSTIELDRPKNISDYFVGHWVEIRGTDGTLKGTWRIESVDVSNRKKITLTAGGASLNVLANDQWQGVYRFDHLTALSGAKLVSNDPVRLGVDEVVEVTGPSAANAVLDFPHAIRGRDVTISGNVNVESVTATNVMIKGQVSMREANATNLTVESGAKLTHPANGATTRTALTLITTGSLVVKLGGEINVSGKGYPLGSTYPDGIATLPGNATGGSHLGQGGYWEGALGSTYGSVYRPMEAGSGAWNNSGSAGGGVVRIDATGGVVLIDGDVRANGSPCSDYGCGAGGSVWITATEYTGSGKIEARGGEGSAHGNGGGGAISLDYTRRSVTSPLVPTMTARGGVSQTNHNGGAGTIYVKGPEATEGDLTIDNASAINAQATVLPPLGGGTLSITSAPTSFKTGRTSIPSYFIGHWVEISDSSNNFVGRYRVASITGGTIGLEVPNGETLVLADGMKWQGVYVFDDPPSVLNGAVLQSLDPICTGRTRALPCRDSSWAAWTDEDRLTGTLNSNAPVITEAPRLTGDGSSITVTIPIGSLSDSDGISSVSLRVGEVAILPTRAPDGSYVFTCEPCRELPFELEIFDNHPHLRRGTRVPLTSRE